MAMPQLMRVDVESISLSPLSADVTDGLSGEVVFSAEAWEDKAVSFAAAKRLKQLQGFGADSHGAGLADFAEQVDLTAVIQGLNVFPPESDQF